MTVEEAAKIVLSAGIVMPDPNKLKDAALANDATRQAK